MTVGSSEIDIDESKNNQEKCYNNNHRETKNKTKNSFFNTTETDHLTNSANPRKLKMGRRKQLVPLKTGHGSELDPATQTSSANDATEENGTEQQPMDTNDVEGEEDSISERVGSVDSKKLRH